MSVQIIENEKKISELENSDDDDFEGLDDLLRSDGSTDKLKKLGSFLRKNPKSAFKKQRKVKLSLGVAIASVLKKENELDEIKEDIDYYKDNFTMMQEEYFDMKDKFGSKMDEIAGLNEEL